MFKQCIITVVLSNFLFASPEVFAAQPIKVEIKTTAGAFTLELDGDKAPITVDNFCSYAKSGFYEGTVFHRVIKTFMIQGGGFDQKDLRSEKKTNAPIKNESSNGLSNAKYTIAMARTSVPDSATSQFFINTGNENQFLDKNRSQDGVGYCVFGRVVAGFEVVDAIAGAAVRPDPLSGENSKPNEPVVIEKVTVLDK